jgi:hypothetical protein
MPPYDLHFKTFEKLKLLKIFFSTSTYEFIKEAVNFYLTTEDQKT